MLKKVKTIIYTMNQGETVKHRGEGEKKIYIYILMNGFGSNKSEFQLLYNVSQSKSNY